MMQVSGITCEMSMKNINKLKHTKNEGKQIYKTSLFIKGAPVCTFIWEEEDYPLNFEGFVSLFSRWICNKIWFLPYQYTSYNIHMFM